MNKHGIRYTFEQLGNVGIFRFMGNLNRYHQDELKLLLMRALYSVERAVLNLKGIKKIDSTCLALLRSAYLTSIRLKNPIIITEIPGVYTFDIFNSEISANKAGDWFPDEFTVSSKREKKL